MLNLYDTNGTKLDTISKTDFMDGINDLTQLYKRLENIIRFSVMPRVKDQTVAEHSFCVAFISLILADIESKVYKKKIDFEGLVRRALCHDIPESFTGDIIFTFKRFGKEFGKTIEGNSLSVVEKALKRIPTCFSKFYFEPTRDCKDSTIEGQIVNAADLIDAFQYASREVKMGNKYMEAPMQNATRELSSSKLQSVHLFMEAQHSFGGKDYLGDFK